MSVIRNRTAVLLCTAAITAALSACGAGAATSPDAPVGGSPSASTAAPGTVGSVVGGAGQRAGRAGFDLLAATNCLKAAGITVPEVRASAPSAGAGNSGGKAEAKPVSGGDALGAVFNSDDAKAALAACGITVPTTGTGKG
jgi:hypothetical protein